MYDLNLQWKSFNVSVAKIREWIDANITTECVGLSANSMLQIHFSEEPSQQEKDDIQAYWDLIDEESDEAVEYQSAQQIIQAAAADKAAKIASARTKLAALGLTDAEIDAIIG